MAKKEHQHFIPKTYLKRFAHRIDGDTHFVDIIDVKTFEIKENIAVSNLCVDCDLYTLKKLSEDEKYKIEDFFNSEIENDYEEVYKILTNDSIEYITLEQRIKILKTIISMYFRTPKGLNEFVANSIEFFKDLKLKENGGFSFMGVDFDLNNKSLTQIKKEIRENNREDYVKTNLFLLAEFLKLRAFDGIVVIKLIGEQEFITCDNPVNITTLDGNLIDLFSLNNSIYVPISSKYCVFIAPTSEGAIVNKIYRNQDNFLIHVIVNDSTLKNSEKWCIGTKLGITKFIAENEVYSKSGDENHPAIVKTKKIINVLLELTKLVESRNFKELVTYVNKYKDDDFLKNDAMFIKIVDQLKGLRLL